MITAKALHHNLDIFYKTNFSKLEIRNPFYQLTSDSKTLTWYNYQVKQFFYSYEEYYAWVSDHLQYSLAFGDHGLIQIFYQEFKTGVQKGSLGFLPHPDLLMTYFRFDMDTHACSDYYHNSFHINFGYRSDDLRFSLNRFPFTSEFLRFCAFLTGNVEFSDFNRKRFFGDLGTMGEKYSHLFEFNVV